MDRLVTSSFMRGLGPLVSVLLPTRGRPKMLCEAIDSLYSLALDKSSIEFILKVDDDDAETIEVSKNLNYVLPIKTIISPRGNGYADMHHWVNEMCSVAKGDWLLLFNDDARMKTPEWDQLLLRASLPSHYSVKLQDVFLLVLQVVGKPFATEFCLLRRKVYELLGHYSLSPQNDAWICTVMGLIHCCFYYPIEIEHLDMKTNDATRKDVKAAYATTACTLESDEAIRGKIADALNLLDYLDLSNSRPNPNIIPFLPLQPRYVEDIIK